MKLEATSDSQICPGKRRKKSTARKRRMGDKFQKIF